MSTDDILSLDRESEVRLGSLYPDLICALHELFEFLIFCLKNFPVCLYDKLVCLIEKSACRYARS